MFEAVFAEISSYLKSRESPAIVSKLPDAARQSGDSGRA